MVFAAVWGGQLVSLLGSGAASFALSISLYAATGHASALSLVTAARAVSTIYLAPLSGALADRFPRRSAALVCNVVLGLLSVALSVVVAERAEQRLWLVLTLVFLSGGFGSALNITLSATVRQVRDEADLTRANGIISLLQNAPTFAGPVLGAAVYTLASPAVVFAVDGATFFLCAVVLCFVRWEPATPTRSDRSLRPFRGALQGFRFIWDRPDLRFLQLSYSCLNMSIGLGVSALTVYVVAASARGAASWNLALVNVSGSAGLLLGSLLVVAVGGRVDRRVLVVGGVVAAALLGRGLLALTAVPALWAVGCVLRNASVQASNAPVSAIWQERVPQEIQATVFGAKQLLGQGLYPVAVAVGGYLVDHLGSRGGSAGGAALLLLIGAAGELVVAAMLLATPALRRLARPVMSKDEASVAI